MRFEARTALIVGILLPVLETYRRGIAHWGVEFTTMLEDYVAGGLLLAGGIAAYRGAQAGPALLLTAWAWMSAMITVSFVDQVEVTMRGVDLEPGNPDVLAVKFLLWSVSLIALVRSFRTVRSQRTRERR